MVLNKNLGLSLLLVIKPEEYEIGCGSCSSGGRAEVKVSMSKILNPKMFLMGSLVPCMAATAIYEWVCEWMNVTGTLKDHWTRCYRNARPFTINHSRLFDELIQPG